MKKLILTLAAVTMTAAFVSAQDLATVTETYNAGAEQLNQGNKTEALTSFQSALSAAEALGEEGAEIVSNCKNVIPNLILSIGKELYNNKDFDGAVEKIGEAVAKAKEYGNEEVLAEAEALLPQVNITKDMDAANDAFKAKDYAAAAEGFKKVLAADESNSAASIRLVQCLSNTGDIDGAKEALALAEANGQGENAKKVLGGALLKNAAAALKAGKFQDAIKAASESTEYAENAQAYLVAGQAATKLNKNNDAISWYEKYLEAAPTSSNANAIAFTVGALYQQAGNKAKAIANYKKVLNDPKFGAQAKQMVDALSK